MNQNQSSFTPKASIPINLGKSTVYIYPTITADMSEAERQHAFTVTKNALKAASSVSFKTRLECLKQHTNSTSIVDVVGERFINHSKDFINQVGNLTISTYHGSNGRVIQDCVDLTTNLLKTCAAQTAANRRPADIKLAKATSMVNFQAIAQSNTVNYPVSFFIDLGLVESRNTTNSTGNAVVLTTSWIPDDWAYSTQANYDAVLNAPGSVGKPFDLKAPAIKNDPNSEATFQISQFDERLEEIALEASWDTICTTIFQEICPTTIDDPSVALQSIRQSSKDQLGKSVSLSVHAYYKSIKQYTDFFPKSGAWPLDVVQHFITHLDDDIRTQTQRDMNYNTATSQKDAYNQNANLLAALKHATNAEKQQSSMNKAIQQQIQGNQALQLSVNMSVAERTIRQYTDAPIPSEPVKQCWGCGSTDHVYARNNVVTCPNKDIPGVKEKAQKVRDDFNKRRRTLNNKRKRNSNKDKDDNKRVATIADIKALIASSPQAKSNQSGGYHVLMTKIIDDLPSDAKIEAAQAFQAEMESEDFNSIHALSLEADSGIQYEDDIVLHGVKTISTSEGDETAINCNSVSVLVSSKPIKPPLPISFDPNVPHISMSIGKDDNSSFKISLAYDTAAQLNVGYAGFHLSIAKAFPSVVKNLIWAKDEFSPLSLSGVVKEEKSTSTSTELSAIIEYYTTYTTKDGAPVTLQIALGNNVGVNTILGLSTIKNAAISMDLDAKVFQVGLFNNETFDINFKPTTHGIPNLSELKSSSIMANLSQIDSVTPNMIYQCYDDVFKSKTEDIVSTPSIDNETTLAKSSALSLINQSTYPTQLMN